MLQLLRSLAAGTLRSEVMLLRVGSGGSASSGYASPAQAAASSSSVLSHREDRNLQFASTPQVIYMVMAKACLESEQGHTKLLKLLWLAVLTLTTISSSQDVRVEKFQTSRAER